MKKTIILVLMVLFTTSVLYGCKEEDKEDYSIYQIKNYDFETGTLESWNVISGNAFESNGIKIANSDNKADGKYFYGQYDEERVGRLRSSEFIIGGCGYISFKLGAGKNEGLTYISIIDSQTNIELYRFSNKDSEEEDYVLVQYIADISSSKGKKVYIDIVDDSTNNTGYILFDSFITYYRDIPTFENALVCKDVKPVFSDYNSTPNVLTNQDFSTHDLYGWSVVGEKNSFLSSHIDESLLLSNRSNEESVGLLRSSAFKVGGIGLISFRLGGTLNKNLTYLSIKMVGTNEEVFRTYSNRWKTSDEERTHLYYVDLSKYLGECLYLEIVDNSRNNWGIVTISNINTLYLSMPRVNDEIAIDIRDEVLLNPEFYVMRNIVNQIISSISDETLRTTLQKTFYATIDGIDNSKLNSQDTQIVSYNNDGTVYIKTGDINAMWLRDSAAQVLAYIPYINYDNNVKLLVKGLLKKQFELIRRDPYANAFNNNGSVFERKFELDSLCYPIWLASLYYEYTKDESIFDLFFEQTVRTIITTFKNEQNHSDSVYDVASVNGNDKNNSNNNYNINSKLIWSGYRPSDDVCHYKFFIPGNMFAVATLERINDLFTKLNRSSEIKNEAMVLANEVRDAIETYGTYNHEKYGKIYAFEVDGFSRDENSSEGKLLMDAANIPSLLSAPWLGYCDVNDEVYQNTRRFILSNDNPYYYEGEYASGIGDPHDQIGHGNNPHRDTPVPWHMSIAMQALTSIDNEEIKKCVIYMTNTTGGTYVMHEAFNANNPSDYSRDWFTWPCSLYAYVVINKYIPLLAEEN